nr:hypothetical protein [Candidatus Sigynarchaeum springense]
MVVNKEYSLHFEKQGLQLVADNVFKECDENGPVSRRKSFFPCLFSDILAQYIENLHCGRDRISHVDQWGQHGTKKDRKVGVDENMVSWQRFPTRVACVAPCRLPHVLAASRIASPEFHEVMLGIPQRDTICTIIGIGIAFLEAIIFPKADRAYLMRPALVQRAIPAAGASLAAWHGYRLREKGSGEVLDYFTTTRPS